MDSTQISTVVRGNEVHIVYEKTLYIPAERLKNIRRYLTEIPTCKDDCLGEDETISYTCCFPHNYEVDIKCCGVAYDEDETEANLAWTEGVLFHDGSEVCCSEASDQFEGDWEFESGYRTFIVHVVAA